MPLYRTIDLFDLSKTQAEPLLAGCEWPWQALEGISAFILELGATLPAALYAQPAKDLWIARDAKVAASALIQGPCIIGPGAQVRHCAFVRGAALIGAGAVVGNSTELKNCILFEEVQVPHYNYVGDSILGYKAHFGAGVITANIRSDKADIAVKSEAGRMETGRRKVGAMVGDFADVGCNSVLAPGAQLGRGSVVYPLSFVRGVVFENGIYKKQGEVAKRR